MKYAFIGSGNMARAIIGGMVRSGTPGENIAVINPGNPQSTGEVHQQYGTVTACETALETADCIVLAVKPQTFPAALPLYAPHVNRDALLVSIMAGISLGSLEAAFPDSRVVRVMPNLNMSVGAGAAGYALGSAATEDDGDTVGAMFAAGGLALRMDETQIDEVAALSGSGSAYLYYLVEALRDAAIEDGMSYEMAEALARQTLIGAAKLLSVTGASPETLRARITSKNGTTQAAINKMAELHFPEAVKAGFRANKARSRELAAETV